MVSSDSAHSNKLYHVISVLEPLLHPQLTIPELTISELTIPELTIPELTIPELTIPELTRHEVIFGYWCFHLGHA